jgi:hypothetical protein
MAGYGGPYASKAEALAFINNLVDGTPLTSDDITDAEMSMANEIINNRTDTYWKVTTSGSLYLDGTGKNYVFSTIVPIVTLTACVIIALDDTTESLTVSGSAKEIIYDPNTGLIKRVVVSEDDWLMKDTDDESVFFPLGIRNIKITGTFGKDSDSINILKQLQILLVLQLMQKKFVGKIKPDLVMEKIGEYEYRVSEMQYAKDPKNTKLTLEGYIEFLFKSLPQDGKILVMGV